MRRMNLQMSGKNTLLVNLPKNWVCSCLLVPLFLAFGLLIHFDSWMNELSTWLGKERGQRVGMTITGHGDTICSAF